MDSDLFNVAIIVLVVLAQLGGAIFAAWKKRQAERERQERRGGMVIVEDDRSSSTTAKSEPSSWDSDEESEPTERASSENEPSYDDIEETEETEEKPEQYWDNSFPEETGEAARQPTSNAAAVASSSILGLRKAFQSESAALSSPNSGKHRGTPRARHILGQGGLRQAILAQVILAPPPATRSLRR